MNTNVLIASVGEPWGYVPATYNVNGVEVIANFSGSALSRVREASRGLLVYLNGTSPRDGAQKRLDEISRELQSSDGEIATAYVEAVQVLEKVISEGLHDEDLIRTYFAQPHYSIAAFQEYIKVPWPDGGQIDLKFILEGQLSDFIIRSGADHVLLDITHGPNFLPVALDSAARWACRIASAQLGYEITLEVHSVSSVRAWGGGMPRGSVSRVESVTFRPDSSMRELAWRILEEEPPSGIDPFLSSAAEASAAAILFSLPLPMVMLADEAPDWKASSSGWEASAHALLSGIKRVVKGSGAEPGHPLSLEETEKIVEGLRSMRIPTHLLAEIELQKLKHKIMEYLLRERGRGTVPLEAIFGGYEVGEDPGQVERNLVAHAGFERSNVMVDLSNLVTQPKAEKVKFNYKDWKLIREVLVAFARGIRVKRDVRASRE